MNKPPNDKKTIFVQLELPEDIEERKRFSELKQIIDDLRELLKDISGKTLYNERELAKHFGISEISLARIRRSGEIKYKRIAGKIYYAKEHINEYLTSSNKQTKENGDKTSGNKQTKEEEEE